MKRQDPCAMDVVRLPISPMNQCVLNVTAERGHHGGDVKIEADSVHVI